MKVAERGGFEPPDPVRDQRFSRPPHSTALASLLAICGFDSVCMGVSIVFKVLRVVAEREGFEPPDPCRSTVFKTAAIDRSAISPPAKVLFF